MYGIGTAELAVIALVLIVIFFPIFLVSKLRKRYPNRLWIGILLGLVIGPLAQYYLPGGLKYIVILAVIFGILHSLIGRGNAYIVTELLGILLIWYRHYKIMQSPLSEVKLQGS